MSSPAPVLGDALLDAHRLLLGNAGGAGRLEPGRELHGGEVAVAELAEVRSMLRILDEDLEVLAQDLCPPCQRRLARVPRGWK